MTLYYDLMKIEEVIELKPGKEDDLLDLQKELLESRVGNNKNYKKAKKGIPLEEQLRELSQENSFFRRLFPRKYNGEYNNSVTSIGELIDTPTQLYRRGILAYDNLLAPFIHISPIVPVIPIVPMVKPEFDYSNPQDMFPLITIGILGFLCFTTYTLYNMLENKKFNSLPYKQAEYIDNKIKTLSKH